MDLTRFVCPHEARVGHGGVKERAAGSSPTQADCVKVGMTVQVPQIRAADRRKRSAADRPPIHAISHIRARQNANCADRVAEARVLYIWTPSSVIHEPNGTKVGQVCIVTFTNNHQEHGSQTVGHRSELAINLPLVVDRNVQARGLASSNS